MERTHDTSTQLEWIDFFKSNILLVRHRRLGGWSAHASMVENEMDSFHIWLDHFGIYGKYRNMTEIGEGLFRLFQRDFDFIWIEPRFIPFKEVWDEPNMN